MKRKIKDIKEIKVFDWFKKKRFNYLELIVLLLVFLVLGFGIGSFNVYKKNSKLRLIDKHLNEFIDNYDYINKHYYKTIDKSKLIKGAISGMIDSLEDPYSNSFSANELDNFNIALKGEYRGFGLAVSKNEQSGYIEVVGVVKNSAASKAKISLGTTIKRVNQIDTVNLEVSDFSKIVRQENNIDLLVEQADIDRTVLLKKETIKLNSVDAKILPVKNKKIGYIYISVFARNTASQFEKQLSQLENKKIDYLIIDIRGNGGGYLMSVHNILGQFLTKSQIMYQIKKGNNTTKIYGNSKNNKSYEIILLGNEMSASASEILISGLKENLGSKFYGEMTYGKGCAQEMVSDKESIQYKITTKKWLTPKGNWLNDRKGIEPDVYVDGNSFYFANDSLSDDMQLCKIIDDILK